MKKHTSAMTSKQERGDKIVRCKYCIREYEDNRTLKAHARKCSAKPLFSCKLCNLRFISERWLKSHLRCHTRDKRIWCNVCKARFANPTLLQLHDRLHEGGRIFRCRLCYNRLASKRALWAHLRLHLTRDGKYVCVHCGGKFANQILLIRHRKSHKSEKTTYPSCKGCKLEFSNEMGLRLHIVEEHSDKKPLASLESDTEENQQLEENGENLQFVLAGSDSALSEDSSSSDYATNRGSEINSASSECNSGPQPDSKTQESDGGECNMELPQGSSLTRHEVNLRDEMTPSSSKCVSGKSEDHVMEVDSEKPSSVRTDSSEESSSPSSVSEPYEKHGPEMPLDLSGCKGQKTSSQPLQRRKGTNTFPCSYCKLRLPSKRALYLHVRRVHIGRRKTRLLKKRMPQSKRNDQDLNSCPKCEFRFSRKRTFDGHFKSVREPAEDCLGNIQRICPHCNIQF